MDRRTFLGTIPLSAAALNLPTAAQATPAPGAGETAGTWPAPPPGVPYFTRQKMESLVDTSVSLAGIPFQVMVYNFPSWHPSPVMEKLFGKGWTEFETARLAKSWFEGEIQPKQPLWGMYDPADPNSFNEADPVWAAREIDLAAPPEVCRQRILAQAEEAVRNGEDPAYWQRFTEARLSFL